MAGKIFINYRRGDDPGFTGRLFDRLEDAFPPEQLFMDVDSIAPGLDFVRVLEEQVAACDIFLAVIGQNWIDARDAAGNRRLDNPGDFVRIEIESALKLGKRIVPVLVNNASMPEADQLPSSLEPFSRRNAVRLSHDRFKADTQTLVKQLQKAREDAEASLRQREDDAARDAELADTSEGYQAFLKNWPGSRHAPAFRNRLKTLRARNDPIAGPFSTWMAGVFALLAPIILFAAYVLLQNQALRKPMEDLGLILFDVDPTSPEAPLVAVIYVSLALFALGLVMLWRVRMRPGLEASFYWLGCVAAVLAILTVLPLLRFNPDLETGSYARGYIGPGNVIIALLIAASAVALVRLRREIASETEIALYWLGSALALVYAVSVYGWYELGGQSSYLVNCIVALVAVAPALFLIKPQAPPNWAELALYGAGITALAAHASTNLSVYFQGIYYVGGFDAFLVGLLTAAALLARRVLPRGSIVAQGLPLREGEATWPAERIAALSLPAQLVMGVLFQAGNWQWLSIYPSAEGAFLSGLVFALILGLGVIAALIVIWRRTLTAAAASYYWLAGSVLCAVGLPSLFVLRKWSWFDWPLGAILPGLIAACGIALATLTVLTFRRWSQLGRVETENYWLGCTLLLSAVLGTSFAALGASAAAGMLVAALIALLSGLWLRRRRQRKGIGMDTSVLWLGIMIPACIGVAWLFASPDWTALVDSEALDGVPSSNGANVTGYVTALVLFLGSAAILAYRDRALSSSAGARYCYGCALAWLPGLWMFPSA